MGFSAEGEIYIPMEEFWQFVSKYLPEGMNAETRFGVPTPTPDGIDMIIKFATSSTDDPSTWSEKPECLKEWDNLRKLK